jgi:hypothetical protein
MLNKENATNYLENMSFVNARFDAKRGDNLYFFAHDEDETLQEIEFEPMSLNRVCVSLRQSINDPFVILEILSEED